MSKLLSSRTSLALTENLRTLIAELPEDIMPSTISASEVLRQLIERRVEAAEEQVAERAYADMATVKSAYREVHRQRRTECATARECALHAEEASAPAQTVPYDDPACGQCVLPYGVKSMRLIWGVVEPDGTPVPPKLWLKVSPNPRNRGLGTFLAVRITTTGKHAELPTLVVLQHGEVAHGWVRCHSLETVYPEDLTGRRCRALSREAMRDVGAGLATALGLET